MRGQRTDRNGPFLAGELLALGVEPACVTIVGDTPEELAGVLREALARDLTVISGGLGPTHDDRTIELLAQAAGRDLVVMPELEQEIEAFSRSIAERLNRPYADFEEGVRKQATLPEGAVSLGLAGTAPGVLLETDGGIAIALPGPPGELQRLWRAALETEPMRLLLARASAPEQRVLRFYGVSESAVARAFADAGGEGDGVEVTICAHEWEIQADLVVREGGEKRADGLEDRLSTELGRYLFARDERPVEAYVLELCREQRLTLATAESCTGGLVAARLTAIPGSSDVFLGGLVTYADDTKRTQLGVPDELLRRHGAVSAETAAAMARGVREALGADVGVAVTGIAGPDGGTAEKPVGLVFVHASTPRGERALEFQFPGGREAVRRRATAAALHLVRRLLTQARDEAA